MEKYFEDVLSMRKRNLAYHLTLAENYNISTLNGCILKIDEF